VCPVWAHRAQITPDLIKMPMQQFVLLPREGLRPTDSASRSILDSLHAASLARPLEVEELPIAHRPNIRILDTELREGPMLLEMEPADAQSINTHSGQFRVTPVVTFEAPEPVNSPDPSQLGTAAAPTNPPTPFTVQCVETRTRRLLAGVRVFATGGGVNDSGITDGGGRVTLTLAGLRLERLWAYFYPTHWGAYRTDIPIQGGAVVPIDIDRVSLPSPDAIGRYYSASVFNSATPVTVGVIDSGVGPHRSLNVVGGRNVAGESPGDVEDWKGHGTHVAGLIGAVWSRGTGVRGIAPGVPIRSYRVFGRNKANTTNYSIMKAMILADIDGCDIINLSLGGGPPDTSVEEAILDARQHGMLVVVAAGNNFRRPVSYPAAFPGAIAVSALGVERCFPSGSCCEGDIDRPPVPTVALDEFIARFSNFGAAIAVTAPGVGLISTLPDNLYPNPPYGVFSGTSMAAPVVTGAAACLLSRDTQIYNMDRNTQRSTVLERLVLSSCCKRGFGLLYEGYGLPDPGLV